MTAFPSDVHAWWATRQTADAREWRRVSAEIGAYVNDLSGRDDLVAVVEPGSGKGHPAVYLSEQASIEVNPDVCAEGVNPADVQATTEVGRLRHPSFCGAAAHEAAHAKFSRWELNRDPKRAAVVRAALLLEEARAEGHLLAQRPEIRVLLRATFDKIVGCNADLTGVRHAAHTLALTDGRVDAGVLDAAEVAPVIDAAVNELGVGRYYALRTIWREAQSLGDHSDQAAMEALGQRWIDVVEAKGDAGPDPEQQIILVCSMPGEGGDGEDGEQGGDSILVQVAKAVSDGAEAEAEAETAAAANRDAAAKAKAESESDKKDDQAADEVFGQPIKIVGHGAGRGWREGVSGTRQPTAAERRQANQLATRLRQAQYRDRHKVTVDSVLPPGRLRGQQSLQRTVQREQGIPVTAKPFRHTTRKHAEQPPLTVGIGCDISGSMSPVTDATASAAWIIASAIRRIEGTTATVAYGEQVHAVVKPGETPGVVREFNASGGHENVIDAQRALTGSLNLLSGRGARLLVLVSDGHYMQHQTAQGRKLAARLKASGVKILWLGLQGKERDRPFPEATYVHLTDPTQVGRIVGDAMVRMLSTA